MVRWCITCMLWSWRQGDDKVEVGYAVSSRPAWDTYLRPCLKKKKEQGKKEEKEEEGSGRRKKRGLGGEEKEKEEVPVTFQHPSVMSRFTGDHQWPVPRQSG